MPFRHLIFALLLWLAGILPAQATSMADPGTPLMRVFGAADTGASPGHFALATGVNGEMFVGNGEGVLHFDGVDWVLTELPGRSPARSLATGSDGLVYVGGYDTFGRLVRGEDGKYFHEDLRERGGLRQAQRHVGVVWEVLAGASGVYFRAESSLHYIPYDQGQARRWPLGEDVRSFYLLDEVLYARVQGQGLTRFLDGRFELEPGGEAFADRPLVGMIDRGDWRLLVSRDGLYRADADGVARVPGEADRLLQDKRSYVTARLGDGSVAIGTLDGQLYRITEDFQLREQLVLGGFGITALALDREGGLWAATEGDLVRLSMPSPWSFLGPDQGVVGSPVDFEWHEDALWVASSRGVARLTRGDDGQVSSEVMPWTDYEGLALHAGENGLLVGLREGLMVLDPGARTPRTLYRHLHHGVFALEPSRHVPGLVYALTGTHLLAIREQAGRWQLDWQLGLDGISVAGFEETAPGELWFGDSRGPAQRWRVDPASGARLEREVFDDARGLAVDAGSGATVYQLDGRIHAVSGKAGFRQEGDRFVADPAPPFTLVSRPFELNVEETALGAFAYTTRELWRRPAEGGEWQALHPGSQASAGYSYLRLNSDGVLRVATWNGILQYDPNEPAPEPQPLRLGFDSVQARAPDGSVINLPTRSVNAAVQVPPGHGLSVRFAMVSMESGAEFRYFLHGITPEWSNWTDRDLFIRSLPAGDYVLEVQARTHNGRQAPAISYHFRVQRRWYEQWWVLALGLFALAGVAVSITLWAVRQRTERYLAANRRLEARIAERTRELEDVNRKLAELVTEDALTGVANRRALENGLRREWFRCLDQRRPLSVLMIDVDNFKAYNDAHGHLEGDVQLRGIAQRLHQQHDPQRELLARYGGEEFALLLPGVHQSEALRRAEMIRAAVAASDAGMTVSIGVAGFVPDVQVEPDKLLRRADAALYVAKRAGRNRVEEDTGAA